MDSFRRKWLVVVILLAAAWPGHAQECRWSRIDHVVHYESSGFWNPTVYRGTVIALTVANFGAAAWGGAQTRLGRTMWQAADAQLIAGVTAEVGKRAFSRVRPEDGGDPCLWFQGGSNKSFPSLESAVTAALVMPYMIEYGADNPAAYALVLLPLYVGAGRIKNQAHWQTDVLGGWAVGALSGWLSHSLETPILIRLLPGGFEVGFSARF